MHRHLRGVVIAAALVSLASPLAACSGDAATESSTTTTGPVIETTTTTEVPLSAGKEVSFFVPAVGDCYDVRPVDKAPPIFLVLDCSLPHENEVFATFDWTATKEYPGADPIETQAKSACPASWDAYVGAPYETSSLEMAFQLPDAAGWGNGIRHVVGCLVVDATGARRTGSARGSGL